MKLTLDLIPESSFFKNVRSEVTQKQWDEIRRTVYKRAGYKCEICGGSGKKHPVECHEIFEYNQKTRVQKLSRLIALCPACHRVKHFGLWSHKGYEEEMLKHLQKVNKISAREARIIVGEAFEEWGLRSDTQWKLDLSLLQTEFGITPISSVLPKKLKSSLHSGEYDEDQSCETA